MSKEKKSLIVFYSVTLVVSLVLEIIYCTNKNESLMGAIMWTPGIVGIICARVFYGKEKTLGILHKFKPIYLLLGILIPAAYLIPSYLITWAITKPDIDFESELMLRTGNLGTIMPPVIAFILFFFLMFLVSAVSCMGEEIGWRGFAYPKLEEIYGPKKAVLINGFIWAIWHVPMIIGGAYQAVVNPVYGVISFMILVMIISIFFCWSRSVTGSVIPAIILHTAHNEIDQVYLKSMSHQESIPYFAGEQGFVTIICAALIAAIVIWSWKKHKKVEPV